MEAAHNALFSCSFPYPTLDKEGDWARQDGGAVQDPPTLLRVRGYSESYGLVPYSLINLGLNDK